jgi:tetratricopeptide (TPR) repeat protein
MWATTGVQPAPRLVADSPFDEARKLLAAGKYEEASASADAALSGQPFAIEGYQVMFDIAKAQDDVEGQLRWGKWLYWAWKAQGAKKELEALTAELDALYEGWNQESQTLEVWQKSTLKAAKAASGKKQFRLAGHLMNKLLDLNPQDTKLVKEYDKLADKAGAELSGGAFVSDKVKRKSAKWLARNNAKHSEWENRWEKKTKSYDVETNMDYAFFETLCAAMDEMNLFYRKVYDFKKKAPRVRLVVTNKRSDFDRFSMELLGRPIQSESVGGYWVSGAKTVASFDRSMGDPNLTRDDLWRTLFHEASHQFMSIKMDKNERRGIYTPAWLDEGTASYFEGCEIKADGTIVKNNVAEQRLRSWWAIEQGSRRKSLEELVAHPRNTGPKDGTLSYEGIFYPYGWAFAYFLLNYEEGDRRVYAPPITPGQSIPTEYKAVRKAGKLVYRQPYLDYIEHFSKVGNKENDQYYPLEMAKKFFIEDVADPDVPNWDAFEKRWRKFTTALYGEMQAGPEFADVLQARCRGYILAEDYERARVTAEQADNKRPNDAVYWMFRHWESVWEAGDEAAAAEAIAWLEEHGGKGVIKDYIEPTQVALGEIEANMEVALEDGHPIMATLFATHAMQAFQLEFPALDDKAKEMAEVANMDLRAWQAGFQKGEESNRKATDDSGALVDVVMYTDDGLLMYNPEGFATPGIEASDVGALQNLTPPFSIRGKVQVDGYGGIILLGIDRSGTPQVRVNLLDMDDEYSMDFRTMHYVVDTNGGSAALRSTMLGGDRWEKDGAKFIEFMIDVDADGEGTFQTAGRDPLPLPRGLTTSNLTGGIALMVYDDSAALFQDVAVRPSTAFWPVAPAEDEDE